MSRSCDADMRSVMGEFDFPVARYLRGQSWGRGHIVTNWELVERGSPHRGPTES